MAGITVPGIRIRIKKFLTYRRYLLHFFSTYVNNIFLDVLQKHPGGEQHSGQDPEQRILRVPDEQHHAPRCRHQQN